MVHVHYSTNESFDMKRISDKMTIDKYFELINNSYKNIGHCPRRVVIDDFINLNLPQWFLMKLITECEELHIFMQYHKSFYNIANIKVYGNIDKYARILGVEFKYINEYPINKEKKVKEFYGLCGDMSNSELVEIFDLRKYFNDNIDVITDLSYTYSNMEYTSHIDFDTILSKNRFQRVLFIRQLLIYLLYKSNFSSPLIGKMLERDHSSILNARDFFISFAENYFDKKDKETLTKLRQNLLTQLKNKDVIINT